MLKLAIVLILLVSATSVAFGLRYLLTKEYMPYHAQVSQSSWAEIPTRLQAVILGMLKVVAAGLIALGIALGWLTLPLSRGESWATWAILSVVLVNGLITIYVTVTLRKVEPTAKTPVAAAASSVALVMVALLLANLA
jgi:hypothetical protein